MNIFKRFIKYLSDAEPSDQVAEVRYQSYLNMLEYIKDKMESAGLKQSEKPIINDDEMFFLNEYLNKEKEKISSGTNQIVSF